MTANYYKHGDYNVICDRCGGKYKRSQVKEEWNGLLTCLRGCWEPRHPQDFVKSKADRQSVPNPRPDKSSVLGTTTLSSGASEGATTITLTSVSNVSKYDSIGITMNDGVIFWTFATADPSDNDVTINSGLWKAADSGNTVYLGAKNNETFQ